MDLRSFEPHRAEALRPKACFEPDEEPADSCEEPTWHIAAVQGADSDADSVDVLRRATVARRARRGGGLTLVNRAQSKQASRQAEGGRPCRFEEPEGRESLVAGEPPPPSLALRALNTSAVLAAFGAVAVPAQTSPAGEPCRGPPCRAAPGAAGP